MSYRFVGSSKALSSATSSTTPTTVVPSAGVSRDYAIVISRNPDNGTSARASRDYAIVISYNPDNGVWARAPPAEGRMQRTTARPTTLDTLQCPSSFGSGDPFSTKATRTISSTLDDLQVDIAL